MQALIGKRRSATRAAIPAAGFTPAHAKFWTSLSFSEFVPELGMALRRDPALPLNRTAWTKHFADGFDIRELDEDSLIRAEDVVVASGSPFGVRLDELRSEYTDWPFMVGNLDCAAWLRNLCSDPDPAAANVYFTVTRGFTLLPPDVANSFPRQRMEPYGSALENAAAVDVEIERLLQRNFIAEWEVVAAELGLPPGVKPTMVLPIGVVLKKGKTRIIIDGSAGSPSVNETQEPPGTVLPNMLMAMAAMTKRGFAWCSDYTDAFCHLVLAPSSVPLCCILWRGKVYAFRRLGFGFRNGPSAQQSVTVSVVRSLSRTLCAAGLHAAQPPAMDHRYPPISAASPRSHFVNALLAFLDDVGGFCSSLASAWFSFAHYLVLCKDLSMVVSFKAGKTDEPRQLLHYLGFDADHDSMTVSLDADRVAAIRAALTAVAGSDDMTVRDALSLVGTLVFCSMIIQIGRVHYRALIDAVTALGPRPRPGQRFRVTPAIRDGIDMWHRLFSLLNFRSAVTSVLRPTVPGEASTDASFTGWAWVGMGLFDHSAWPIDWTDRIGRAKSRGDSVDRIWICELELWAVVFLCRRLVPRCAHSRLIVRVDNKPVCQMFDKLSTRSAACLPLLTEICWLLASWDVVLDVRWIDTKSNLVPDTLSRLFSPDHDQALYASVVRDFMASEADNPEWAHWAPQPPIRPELFDSVPVASPEQFSSAWAKLDPAETARLLPHYLQR